ncbi:P-loop containing nucleoside triphosphate hydrolase protein [Blastocladiella britannica]|nr:P-loop containing nucleoside triphosphate hydrolase protein [Blastocladiella britannica]
MSAFPPSVDPRHAAMLVRANIDSCEEALLRSPNDLAYELRALPQEVARLRYLLAAHLARPVSGGDFTFADPFSAASAVPASVLLTRQTRLSTGDAAIDALLGGGLVVPGVTEIAGPAAAGKTQLCLQVLAAVAARGVPGRAVYIPTEAALASSRLPEIASARGWPDPLPYISTADQLMDAEVTRHVLQYQLPVQLARGLQLQLQHDKTNNSKDGLTPGVVVLDSITPLFRGADEFGSGRAKAAAMGDLARVLHKLSAAFHVAVVVVNQAAVDVACSRPREALASIPTPLLPSENADDRRVSALNMQPWRADRERDRAARGDPAPDIPALGLEWARAVRHRVFLERRQGGNVRVMRVLPTVPSSPSSVLRYAIRAGGLVPDDVDE